MRINDRGPFVANRLIDLSYTAAAKLDMTARGHDPGRGAGARRRACRMSSRAPRAPPPALYVQAGAFADAAERAAAARAAAGRRSRPRLHRTRRCTTGRTCTACASVRSSSVAQFDELAARLAALGITDARLALD